MRATEMRCKVVRMAAIAGMAWLLAPAARGEVPAPPVNQWIGMPDVLAGNLTEAQCRACHSSGVLDRHHLLYGKPIPPGSQVPYPDGNGDGAADTNYSCVSCHGWSFTVQRNCVACHTTSPHHTSAKAQSGNCKACHGSVVDNRNDGHYIPTYAPTSATPKTSRGYGLPLNNRGNGAGACNYCHDSGASGPLAIATSSDLHHEGKFDCTWCHDVHFTQPAIRVCENCHGPNSLHTIQADSPAPENRGAIVVGGEWAGYGHVGRNGAPGDSDCRGCHGAPVSFPAGSVPTVPSVQSTDRAAATAGTSTTVIIQGASLVNTSGNTLQETDVTLTAADGASATLTPDVILDEGAMAVTIPANLPPGNYTLQATKAGRTSNATAIAVVPKVKIDQATSQGKIVTIAGDGFGGYARRSATGVSGTTAAGRTVKATILSWSDDKIVAVFGSLPGTITVRSVFGTATAGVKAQAASAARRR